MKPRGHYAKSAELRRYFRTMMWCGRIDLKIAGVLFLYLYYFLHFLHFFIIASFLFLRFCSSKIINTNSIAIIIKWFWQNSLRSLEYPFSILFLNILLHINSGISFIYFIVLIFFLIFNIFYQEGSSTRQLGAAAVLHTLLSRTPDGEQAWNEMNNLLETLVGVPNSMTFPQLGKYLKRKLKKGEGEKYGDKKS